MHWVGESRREIAYRNGREIDDSSSPSVRGANPLPAAASRLTTWGEFGPILKSVLDDSFVGTVHWSRWQISESNVKVAVFRFAIPQSASHYLVDFCCYRKSQDDPEEYPFRRKPAYHGELYVDQQPVSSIASRFRRNSPRMTPSPHQPSPCSMERSISAGKTTSARFEASASPSFTVALSNPPINSALEEHVNIVHFLNYHKFGSTSRIFPQ